MNEIGKASLLFETAIKNEAKTVEPLANGLSNSIFLVNKEYVVRLKKKSDPPFYSPLGEKKILEAISLSHYEIAPTLNHFDTMTGDKIEGYVDGFSFFPIGKDVSIKDIAPVIETLKKLHSIQGEFPDFMLLARYSSYKEKADFLSSDRFEKTLRDSLLSFIKDEPKVLSHNDLWSHNILVNQGKVVLLDFEFAGLNLEGFDLVSLLGENKVTDLSLIKEAALLYYGDSYTDQKGRHLIILYAFSHYLWKYWALSRFEVTKKKEFLAIVKDKESLIEEAKSLSIKRPDLFRP